MKKCTSILTLCAIIIITLSLSCTMSPEKAKEKIQKMGMDYNEQTFLNEVHNKNLEVVKLFLVSGMNPDLKDSALGTPLFWATKENDTAMVKLLLDYGAQIDFRSTEFNATPLMCAIVFKSFEVANLLIEKGADIKAVDNNQTTVLGYSLLTCDTILINRILNLGVDINSTSGKEPIIAAAVRTYNPDVVKLILERGANPNAKTESGVSPLFIATVDTMCDVEILKLLIEAGADVNDSMMVENYVVDLLFTAAYNGMSPEKGYVLVKNGAKAIKRGIVRKKVINNILAYKFNEKDMMILPCEIHASQKEPYIRFIFESYIEEGVSIACTNDMFLLKEARISLNANDYEKLIDKIELMSLIVFGKEDTPQIKDWLSSVLKSFNDSKNAIYSDSKKVNIFNSNTIDDFNNKYENVLDSDDYSIQCYPNCLQSDKNNLLTSIDIIRKN